MCVCVCVCVHVLQLRTQLSSNHKRRSGSSGLITLWIEMTQFPLKKVNNRTLSQAASMAGHNTQEATGVGKNKLKSNMLQYFNSIHINLTNIYIYIFFFFFFKELFSKDNMCNDYSKKIK